MTKRVPGESPGAGQWLGKRGRSLGERRSGRGCRRYERRSTGTLVTVVSPEGPRAVGCCSLVLSDPLVAVGEVPCGCGRRRQHIHTDPLGALQVLSDGPRRPAQALLPLGGPGPSPGPVSDPWQAGGYVVEQLLNRKTVRGRTYYLVRWQGHTSADDSWEPAEKGPSHRGRSVPASALCNNSLVHIVT